MGKISILTKKQEIILNELKGYPEVTSSYYFTGGTVLSEYYLKHRLSEDLDFFCEDHLDPQIHMGFISGITNKYSLTVKSSFIDPVNIHLLNFPDGETVKVDFSIYPYRRLFKSGIIDGIEIDSKLDIAVNKLSTIMQRREVKDFVDLYFLMKKHTYWDLREGVRKKFRMDIEPFMAAGAFVGVEDFEVLPKMIKPLTLDQLKRFFRKEALKLGKTATRQ